MISWEVSMFGTFLKILGGLASAKVLPIHPTMHAFTQARNMWFPHTALTQLLSAADLCIPVEHLPPAGSQFPWKHSDRSNHNTCLTPSEVVSKEVLDWDRNPGKLGRGGANTWRCMVRTRMTLHWDGQRCHPLLPQYPIAICHKTIKRVGPTVGGMVTKKHCMC